MNPLSRIKIAIEKGCFVDETLWPEFMQVIETLRSYLDSTTERIIAEVVHADSSDAAEVAEPRQITKAR